MTSFSLKDLKSKRAAMTQGEWVSSPEDAEDGEVYTDDPYKIIVRISRAPVEANATGIVATHNAADVLIECVSAALAYRDTKAARDSFGAAAYKADPYSILTDDFIERRDGMERQIRERERELLAVLAKVMP